MIARMTLDSRRAAMNELHTNIWLIGGYVSVCDETNKVLFLPVRGEESTA
jgi:hypothetical protein